MSKGALINIQVALICLAGSFRRLHHSGTEPHLFGQHSMDTHSPSTFPWQPLIPPHHPLFPSPPLPTLPSMSRETQHASPHNLHCVICDPALVLLFNAGEAFDKVKVIFCRSHRGAGEPGCRRRFTFFWTKNKIRGCASAAVFLRRPVKACDIYFG